MQLEKGKCVVYRGAEICRINAIETKCMDGTTEREYLILSPVSDARSTYYVPVENADSRLRELLSRDEVLSLIDSMAGEQAEWCSSESKNDRKARQHEILSGNDYTLLISMAQGLHNEQEKRRSIGKRLLAADEKSITCR